MGVLEIIESFNTNLLPKLDGFIDDGLVPFMLLFTGGLVMIYIGYAVIVSMVDIESKLDPYVIIRPVLVLVGLKLYTKAVPMFFTEPAKLLTDLVNAAAMKATGFNDIYSFDGAYTKAITNVQDGVYDIVQVNPFLEFAHMVLYFLAVAASAYILLRQVLVKAIYYALGPIVLPMSLILGNKEAFKSWALGYISVLLWAPLLSLMKMLIILMRVPDGGFTEVIISIVFQAMLVFSVLQIPKYAGILIHRGTLGQVLGAGTGRKVGGEVSGALTGGAKNLASSAFSKLRGK